MQQEQQQQGQQGQGRQQQQEMGLLTAQASHCCRQL
jgi:hypothetical protein